MSKLILVLAMITTMVSQSFSQSLAQEVDKKTKMNFVFASICRMNKGFNTETNTLVPGNYTGLGNVEYTITVNDNTATIASIETITIPNSKEGLEQAFNQTNEAAKKASKELKAKHKEEIAKITAEVNKLKARAIEAKIKHNLDSEKRAKETKIREAISNLSKEEGKLREEIAKITAEENRLREAGQLDGMKRNELAKKRNELTDKRNELSKKRNDLTTNELVKQLY